jgi:hypothetical protein
LTIKSILLATLITPLMLGRNIPQKDTMRPSGPDRYATCGDPKSPKESLIQRARCGYSKTLEAVSERCRIPRLGRIVRACPDESVLHNET